MKEIIESLAEAIYNADIDAAILNHRPSRFIELAGESSGTHAYESVGFANLPASDKANYCELAQGVMAGWEKRV